MLLRRITQHIKDQNWFAVLIDFLIVVIGILLALQIANWNEARNNLVKENEFYKHLLKNLESDLIEFDTTLKYSEWRMSAINQVNREITGKDIPHVLVTPFNEVKTIKPTPKFEYENAAPTAIGFFATFEGHRSAFDALISSGDIGIIRNKSLLQELQEYYVKIEGLDEMEIRLTVFRDQLHSERSKAGVASPDEMTISELAKIVANNPPFFASMKGYWHFSEFHRRTLIAGKLSAEQLITKIKSEIY